jgi:anthranilate phosphoribosyltransferase
VLESAPPVAAPAEVMDTCGTGGDGLGTFNVSTVTAFVVAGAGVPVAKQADRAVSSECGSADVTEALGIRLATSPDQAERDLAEAGLAILFAPSFHPSLARTAAVRDELEVATVLDFLWPLTNPARPSGQLVGVADPAMLPVMAGVLASRGTRAYVVRGADGLDEITLTGPTEVFEVRKGMTQRFHLLPIEVGVPVASIEQLAGGGAEANATRARQILGGEPGPAREAVLVNAAAALVVAGIADEVADGVGRAAEVIDSGKAAAVLDRLVESSNRG